ncbi:hypothetical protein D3C81_1986420 [compost metagenome]
MQEQDGARAQKADAADHLRGDTRGVEHDVRAPQHVAETECRNDDRQRGTHADQHVGAQPRRPFQAPAIDADHRAQHRCQQQPQPHFRP